MSRTILPPAEVKARLKEEAAVVEAWLKNALDGFDAPAGLRAAMDYSLHAGGKRIRPVLCRVCAQLCGLDPTLVMPFAGAIECIHTYSLIHDDLPAMDNDDLRRGKPSCHKQFDEATAILAGDSLLTDAFALMARCADNSIPAERVVRAISMAARAAGSGGMAGGQFLDMEYTARRNIAIEALAAMQAMKTGAMLRLSCEAGAVLAGGDPADVAALAAYGAAVGAAFQIADDILDETGTEEALGKPVGSDRAEGKNTYPSLLGLEESRRRAEEQAEKAVSALAAYASSEAALLRGLAAYIVNRVS